ncbi:MAG: type II toxin-antitoxin system PemK/MazF family toxin [Chloroflexota bacterium]|nr:type II toxin-antitoxin system PemK/MazF family toxin [Chloroflexota bacterium]
MKPPQRGELYWANLDPVIESEIAKTRPVLIISNDVGNQYADRVIVAPISSSSVRKTYPFEVHLNPGEGGLSKESKILLDQIRTLDKSRLGEQIGTFGAERIEEVNRAIRISLAV